MEAPLGKLTRFLTKAGEERRKPNNHHAVVEVTVPEGLKEVKLTDVEPRLLTFHDPESLVAENFKILRSHILHPRTGLPSKLIMVTSSVPGEGKTYVALNLAFSFARSVPTLLVEADLRHPSFTEYLGVPFEEGLSEYFLGQRSLTEIVYRTDFANLYLIPSGRELSLTKDVFSSEKLVEFLDDLRHHFPKFYLIFDSAPVLLASETLSLSRLIDGALLVVRYAYSEKGIVEEALEKLGRSKVLGLIFNAFNISSLNLISSKFKYYRYTNRYYRYHR